MSNKEYRQKYYQEHKKEIKAKSKERYAIKRELELKARNIANVGNSTVSTGSTTGATFFNLDSPNVSNICSSNNVMSYLNSWIYSCATINASSVASQQLRLYATVEEGASNKFLHKSKEVSNTKFKELRQNASLKGMSRIRQAEGVVEILDHPLLTLLDNINPFNNTFESFELTSMYLDMIGDGYWWVRKDDMGMPESIWVLQGQFMRIVQAKTMEKFIKGYLYGIPTVDSYGNTVGKNNGLTKFKTDEIIHFKTPNPQSMYYGLGAAQAVIGAINRMAMMDTSEGARLRNMGRPDFIVNYKGKLDNTEIKKIERMWGNAFGGPNKAGKIKIMDEDFTLEKLGFSPKDMEYLSGRVWSLKEIASAFGVPYSYLDSSDAKKATSEIAERTFAKTSILPRITRIAEKLNEQLIPYYDMTGRMFLAYDSPVPQDQKVLLEENIGYVSSGIITVNEARIRAGFPILDGEEYDKPRDPNADSSDGSDGSDGTGHGKLEVDVEERIDVTDVPGVRDK